MTGKFTSRQDETTDQARIEATDLTKEYGRITAVDDVSISIGRGEYHCLLGPNGSGKSTLLRLLLELTRPTSGSVSVPPVAIGCGFQQPNFYPGLTVRENIDVFASLVGADDWDWNQTVVDELRLNRALDRKAADLSGGYGRKLDLALALIKEPDFLFLDEPLGAMDDVSKARFLEFLGEYPGTIVVATHQVTQFAPYLDRVTVMHRGSVVFDDLIEEIDLTGYESLQQYYVDAVLAREGVDPEAPPPTEPPAEQRVDTE